MNNELYFVLKNGLDISTFTDSFDQDTNFCYIRPELNKSKDKYLVYLHEKVNGWNIYGITNNRLYADYTNGVKNKLVLWNVDTNPMGTTVNMTVPLYFDIRAARNGTEWEKLNTNRTHNDAVDAIRYALPWCNDLKNKKETKMGRVSVEKVKFSGPATIVFFSDGSKYVVKCKDEKNDPEKGLAMAIAKGMTKSNKQILMKDIYIFDSGIEVVWLDNTVTEMYWKDETHDIEKHIALAKIKKSCALVDGVKNTKWYSKFQAIFKKYYKPETNKFIPMPETERPAIESGMNHYVNNRIDEINSNYVIEMFNSGASISRISKETGLTEYFVKKFIDAATNPKVSKNKAARILNKAAKSIKKEKKHRGGHREKITITCPNYLDEETGNRILEETKIKYAGRYKYESDLNKFYIRECKKEYVRTHYNNGYSSYDIAKVIDTNAAGVMRIWNSCLKDIEEGE